MVCQIGSFFPTMVPSSNGEISTESSTHECGIPVIEDDRLLSNVEKKLKNLFKCSQFKYKCFFTADDPVNFTQHLETRHFGQSIFCIYCYNENIDHLFTDAHDLVNHIMEAHSLRTYQCNQCIYRASSKTHVHLHQANVHGDKYQATINGDTSTEICKIIACPQVIQGPRPDDVVYWSNCKTVREENSKPAYQCLYCDFTSTVAHVVFFHICKAHADYNLCLYDKWLDPLPKIEEAEEKQAPQENSEDEELDGIIYSLQNFDQNERNVVDDEDMDPIDDPLPELNFEDDKPEDGISPSRPLNTRHIQEERLFAKKGERIAREKAAAQSSKNSKAKKSTASRNKRNDKAEAIVSGESETSDIEDDREEQTTFIKHPRGYRPENKALFEPMLLAPTKHNVGFARNMFKCLICNDQTPIKQAGITNHLRVIHNNATSSFKCSECNYIGSKTEITGHFSAQHPFSNASAKVMKFIVPLEDQEQTIIQNVNQPSTSKQSEQANKQLPGEKKKATTQGVKNLSTKIQQSVFVGPKSWKEKKARLEGKPIEESAVKPQDSEKSDSDDEKSEEELEEYKRKRKKAQRKRKTRGMESDEETTEPKEIESLVEAKSSRERESENCFCLFCKDYLSQDFEDALSHMKLHLNVNVIACQYCNFKCTAVRELKDHNVAEHPDKMASVPKQTEAFNGHINYIIEFLNEQFKRRRRGDQMSHDIGAYIVCPICERANELTGDSNYYFTKWRAFKIHFWKHANASFLDCKFCGAYVPRTRKRFHLQEQHKNQVDVDISSIKDFSPYFTDPLLSRAIGPLRNIKKLCKARYIERIKEEFGIKESSVMMDDVMKDFAISKVKTEPEDNQTLSYPMF